MQDFIQQFTFADPWWLLGLIALIPLIFIGGKSGTPTAITYSSLSILASLGRKPRRLPGFVTFSLLLLALICAIIAMARPQLRNEQSESTASGVDIILAIDISYSMQIVDFVLNGRRAQRITVAKNTAEAFINQRQNDRMGIVAFSGRPYITSPITLEHDWLIDQLRELRPGGQLPGGRRELAVHPRLPGTGAPRGHSDPRGRGTRPVRSLGLPAVSGSQE